MFTDNTAARAFAALGNPTRLAILRLLVRAGCDGLNMTGLREALDIPASTFKHHLDALVLSGLVKQIKTGRDQISTADYAAIQQLSAHLMENCCAGEIQK